MQPHGLQHASLPSFPISRTLLRFTSIELVMLSNHLILCCPLLLFPSIFPSIRVFPNESALRIRWPKYWSFNFSITSLQRLILMFYFLLSLLMIVNSHRELLINRFGMMQTNLPFYNKVPSVMGAGERVLDLGVRFDFGFCHLPVIQPVSPSEKN